MSGIATAMKTILICMSISLSSMAYSSTLRERVSGNLQALKAKMGDGTSAQQALNLIEKEGRRDVFALQIHGRLFQDEFKVFRKMKKDFKELEDSIGKALKWKDMLDQDDLDAGKIKKYNDQLKEETANLAVLLKKWKSDNTLNYYQTNLSEVTLTLDQSKKLAIKKIKGEVKSITEKEFDFRYGETGLHELKRTLRWPLQEMDLFKDLFTIKKVECGTSSNNLLEKGLKSNFLSLKTNPTAAVTVDYCSYLRLAGAVEVLGKIKDKLERQEVLDDELPEDLRIKTQAVYDEVMASSLDSLF